MLKKYLALTISILLIITSVTGISLVTTYATGDVATPDAYTTTANDTGIDVPPTIANDTGIDIPPSGELDTSVRDITRWDLERYVNQPSWGHQITPGTMFDTEEFDQAFEYAKEILAKPDATQEELNNAYYGLLNAERNIKVIGWLAAPFLSGDFDHDDEVTMKDATGVLMLVARFTRFVQNDSPGYCFADVNDDFRINIKDVTMIQCYVAGYTDRESCGYTGLRASPQYYYNSQYELG